jgi:Ca2+-transporting ATPase
VQKTTQVTVGGHARGPRLAPEPEGSPETPWHSQSVQQTLAGTGTSEAGLSDAEAGQRLQRYGPNEVDSAKSVSWLTILANQLATVVVLLLVAAAVISFAVGDSIEAAAVAVVLVINTTLGFVIDLRARHAMAALRGLQAPRAMAVRDGHVKELEARGLVPGDLIELQAGQAVPADARLIRVNDLRTIESSLTGESLPVSKDPNATLAPDTPLADRVTMTYKGTTIAAGTGRAIVIATGGSTELGRIGKLIAEIEEERTPLERRLDALGHRLVWVALGVGGLVSALAALQGEPLALVLKTGIALAVAAVPEALPAVTTIALAVGLHRMARRHALVRRLPAVEALGSTTIICSDKTQTLTSGNMALSRVWAGEEFTLANGKAATLDPRLKRALEVGALSSLPESGTAAGEGSASGIDPVDTAFLKAATAAGIDVGQLVRDRPRVGFLPFSTERKLTAAFHQEQNATVAYAKGAPEQIVERCDRVIALEGEEPVPSGGHERLLAVNTDLASRGLRVLGLSTGRVPSADESALTGLICAGFGGLIDPPADGVKETIARLKGAGLRTIMITGDQRLTAAAVARELGLLEGDGEVIEGRELATMSRDELKARLAKIGALSRVSPEDKLTVVKALQDQGEIVAMLGDGVNDAPALRKADVGVAMGLRGTDVAKEASAIVLQDDRFETIAAAVEEGRIIYDNIQKFVFYLFSCNLAEVMVVLVVGLAGLPLPLLPLQILWLNIVTDSFTALALAVEPGDPHVMRRPPRNPQEALLSKLFLKRIAIDAALITGVTLVAFLWALERGRAYSTTMAFMTLALAQIFHLSNARRNGSQQATDKLPVNRYAIAAIVLTVALQLAAVYVPALARVLDLAPMGWKDWAIVGGLAVMPVAAHWVVDAWRTRTKG